MREILRKVRVAEPEKEPNGPVCVRVPLIGVSFSLSLSLCFQSARAIPLILLSGERARRKREREPGSSHQGSCSFLKFRFDVQLLLLAALEIFLGNSPAAALFSPSLSLSRVCVYIYDL